MRLLHIKSDGHLEFTKDIIRVEEIPPYAILSHTWKEPEVVFNDLKSCDIMGVVDPEKRDAWNKIQFCAQQAKRNGLDYFWVDTCCIDRANHTELSEAINSMFRWYQNSSRCYVFLPDVEGKSSMEGGKLSSAWKAAFRASRWFTRGWTLQELLAPRSVEFFSRDGTRLGDKESLKQTIHELTKIPLEALSGSDMSKFEVEERFSWAKDRQTTREEDGAYCLLGVLGCSLSPIYGEGKEMALKRLRKEVQEGERLVKIRNWLSAPDPSMNYHKAHNQRQPGTGLWLQQHESFQKWKEDAASRLWLYGIPGCGKTILSSTVVEHLQHHCGDDKRKVTVYFYFDFNDAQKQIPELMLRSLLRQLLQHTITIPECVDALFSSCGDGQQQPPLHKLLSVAPQVMGQFTHVYIVLDALDECAQRPELMDLLIAVAGLRLDSVHLLMTSRKERDIETSLETFVVEDNMINLHRDVVDEDILRFVQQKLRDDRRLEKWNKNPEVRQEIETALMRGAQGMFRWVTCQLDLIAECRNLAMLRKSLATLPKTLDQTYDRILTAISEEDRIYTIRILQWLTFSATPLSLEEVAEVAAIDGAREPAFNRDEVLMDPLDALKICSSLVTITKGWGPERKVTLAHYSVQEYLVSERIRQGSAKQYSMQEAECHKVMTIGCLWYLNRFQVPMTNETFDTSALAFYSASFWHHHLRKTGDGEEEMSRLAMTLLLMNKEVFANSIEIYDPFGDGDELVTPLYFASSLGLTLITKLLLDQDVDVNERTGGGGTALLAAVAGRHLAVVELLVKAKADVDFETPYGQIALHSAIGRKETAIVKVLIDAGADVNKRNDDDGYPIQIASETGDQVLVKMLIDAKADINAQGEGDDHALLIALYNDDYAMAKLLIDAGANPNVRDKKDHSALQTASSQGEESVVRLLINAGANLNAPGGPYFGHALLAAAISGHAAVVEVLLDEGAEIDAQHAWWGSALHGAVRLSQEATAEVLLRRGASFAPDMQSKGVINHAVDSPGCTLSLVKLLQQYNVPLDSIDVNNMTPLHYCVKFEHEAIARQLIDAGVPIDARVLRKAWSDGSGKPEDSQVETTLSASPSIATGLTPLHLAALKGKPMMTKFLLEHGADPNALSQHGETPLHLALRATILGHECEDYWDQEQPVSAGVRKETVRALLADPRMSPRATDDEGESPLHCAIQAEDVESVKSLLSMGANVFPTSGTGINVLHLAAQIRNHDIVVALLESEQAKAATLITSKDKNGRNVLHRMFWADWHGVKTVQWLLDHGADGSELDNFGVSPLAQYLKSHSSTLDVEICRSLLDTREAASFVGYEEQTLGHFCAKRFDFRLTILEVFDEGGVDLTKKDCRGRTVLHYAVLYNTLTEQVLMYLVTAIGIKADDQDEQGRTALQYAIEKVDAYHNRDSWDFIKLGNIISLLSGLQERERPPLLIQPDSSIHLPNTSLQPNPNGNRMQ